MRNWTLSQLLRLNSLKLAKRKALQMILENGEVEEEEKNEEAGEDNPSSDDVLADEMG